MGYRGKDARPRLALWMLVALGDVVLLLASAGLPVMMALLVVVTVTVVGMALWRLTRRGALVRANSMSAPVAVPGRRRA